MARSTIKDIASALNLSKSTVSYALNDGPRSISIELKEQVLAKAQEMGYRRNHVAHALARNQTGVIGLLAPNVAEGFFHSPYYQAFVTHFMAALQRVDFDVRFVLQAQAENAGPDHSIALAPCDGILAMDGVSPKLIRAYADAGIPVVYRGGERIPGTVHYSIDNEKGTNEALGYLYRLGHRSIAMLKGSSGPTDGEARVGSFLEFAKSMNLDVPPHWIQDTRWTFSIAAQCVQRLWSYSDPPTALFCSNDQIATGALVGLSELGLRSPSDVSVVGYDDVPLASLWYPRLTTVHQPIEEMTRQAAVDLVALIAGEEVPDRSYTTELVVRSTTGPPNR